MSLIPNFQLNWYIIQVHLVDKKSKFKPYRTQTGGMPKYNLLMYTGWMI